LSTVHTDRYLEFIIEYTEEWHTISSRKVAASLKKADKLRKGLDHYEAKVNRINFDKDRAATKGGTSSDAYNGYCKKLERNEEKMKVAKAAYDSANQESTALIEEVTVKGWKDLFPALMKLTQSDASLASDEHTLLKNLNAISKSLASIKATHNLIPEGRRLQNIENFESMYRLKHLEKSWNNDLVMRSALSMTGSGDESDKEEDKFMNDIAEFLQGKEEDTKFNDSSLDTDSLKNYSVQTEEGGIEICQTKEDNPIEAHYKELRASELSDTTEDSSDFSSEEGTRGTQVKHNRSKAPPLYPHAS